jgi:O-antigen ligase/Flp pilus assembly protein TadD
MQGTNTAQQVARWVALGALFLIPLTPLIVSGSLFFPFITGKAFFFRIVVEIAVSAWVVLALLDKDYRPRFSWIGVAVVAFVAWMFIADSFAPNAAKAFWSNFERMEGWVLLIHLLGLFFASSAVLRVEKRWRAWFLTSLGVSIVICGYALLQLMGVAAIHQGATRIDASLGNSAYLAIYLLFNTFIALWLGLSEVRPWLKWTLLVLAAFEGFLIFSTGTRGTVIGLVIGLFIASILTALTAGRRARQWAIIAIALLVVTVGSFYVMRTSSFVRENFFLQRIAQVSLKDGATRFTLWRMAVEGVKERPLVGWGQEGFNYIFNTHYDPSLFTQEQWFDRAHNAFVDWLTAGGVPAFLLYLSLFGTAFVLLWRTSELSRAERVMLTAALAGYAIHNFFVFDNLFSYVYFFLILALIDSQTGRPIGIFERARTIAPERGVTYALPVAVVCAITMIWIVNVSGLRVATGLITALSAPQGIGVALTKFEELVARPAFAAQEIREQLIYFAVSAAQSEQISQEEKQRAVTLAVQEMQKQIEAYPRDARLHMELSYAYRAAGDMPNAAKALESAIALSPKKESMWVDLGILAWDAGDFAGAQKAFETAYALGPQFPDLGAYAAAGAIAVKDHEKANTILLQAFGTTTVDNNALNAAYLRAQDWKSLAELWTLRVAQPEANAQTWFSLAAVYYAAGDSSKAIETIKAATSLFPDMASSAAEAIREIEGKATGKQ